MIAKIQLDSHSLTRLRNSAKKANALERIWKRKFDEWNQQIISDVLGLWEAGKQPSRRDFDPMGLVLEHSFDVSREAMAHAEWETEKGGSNLSKPPKSKMPKSLRDLFALYESYRHGKIKPKRQIDQAKQIQQAYFDKVQDIWEKRGKDFREGKAFDRSRAQDVLEKEMPVGRAKMTVQTETTYYYNEARRKVYDQSEDVTHYLFVAIRDHATTRWCRTRQGLVYKKGDSLMDKEQPPCHWNCRSEVLPLTRQNASHRRLIEDKSKARRNNSPEPLPPNWNRR